MALNPYIRVNTKTYLPEENLMEDLTVEAIKIYGNEIYYIPRDLVKRDDLFGESKYSRFTSFKMIEMYMDTTTAFEGGDTFTKFGFEIRDSVKFTVSKKRFKRETGIGRPLEGDLLYFPLSKGLFEVKFVEHENPFYQLGKLYSYANSFSFPKKPSIQVFPKSMQSMTKLDSKSILTSGGFMDQDLLQKATAYINTRMDHLQGQLRERLRGRWSTRMTLSAIRTEYLYPMLLVLGSKKQTKEQPPT